MRRSVIMRTIHKQELNNPGLSYIYAPVTKILAVKVQYGTPAIWYEIDDTLPAKNVVIYVVGTGHDMHFIPAGARYIDTVLMYNDSLVLHVYSVGD